MCAGPFGTGAQGFVAFFCAERSGDFRVLAAQGQHARAEKEHQPARWLGNGLQRHIAGVRTLEVDPIRSAIMGRVPNIHPLDGAIKTVIIISSLRTSMRETHPIAIAIFTPDAELKFVAPLLSRFIVKYPPFLS